VPALDLPHVKQALLQAGYSVWWTDELLKMPASNPFFASLKAENEKG